MLIPYSKFCSSDDGWRCALGSLYLHLASTITLHKIRSIMGCVPTTHRVMCGSSWMNTTWLHPYTQQTVLCKNSVQNNLEDDDDFAEHQSHNILTVLHTTHIRTFWHQRAARISSIVRSADNSLPPEPARVIPWFPRITRSQQRHNFGEINLRQKKAYSDLALACLFRVAIYTYIFYCDPFGTTGWPKWETPRDRAHDGAHSISIRHVSCRDRALDVIKCSVLFVQVHHHHHHQHRNRANNNESRGICDVN